MEEHMAADLGTLQEALTSYYLCYPDPTCIESRWGSECVVSRKQEDREFQN